MFIITIALSVNPVFAASGTKTVNSSSSMSLILTGGTAYSNYVTFNATGCPAGATVDKIEINVGSLAAQGAILTNHLEISSSNRTGAETISWPGAGGAKLTTSNTFFFNTAANGTYQIRFNGTFVGGAIVGGTVLNTATKTYSNPSIKIYYTY
jgi:hypothetical protein